MAGWRAVDQEPVASRHAITAGLEAVLEALEGMSPQSRPVVAACWQDQAYIDVPDLLLERIAAIADLTVACTGRPTLPPGATHVRLEDGHSEADEWSVVGLNSGCGIAFVAHEVHASLPATTVEGGRTFRYDVSTETPLVVAHARRLHRMFGARLAPRASAHLAEVITQLSRRPDLGDDALETLGQRVHKLVEEADRDRRDATMNLDTTGGLAMLAGWLGDAGPRAPALGMVVVRSNVRGVTAVLRQQARAIGRVGDLIVDVPPDAAMLVLPGLVGDVLQRRADEVCEMLTTALGSTDVNAGVNAEVDACAIELPAETARRDIVGGLSQALARLRSTTPTAATH
jgi:hypothetical protein